MILAGTDTSVVTLEWAMSFFVNHPEVLQKARAEVDAHVGRDRLIDEHDLHKLPYLQAIIFETMRLCPPAPLLVPHMSSDDSRDSKIWDDPTSFKPERFGGREVEGHKLMPFGFGRRACPGAGLAQRVVGLTLGSLIQCFDWERVGEDLVDLTEGSGLTMPKVEPLEAMCQACDIMKKVLYDGTSYA
ncbi:hypothetical protein Vadar_027476 [Vaccinium darrowii]|uniref:Uncharacterized protein n=1 Tax=Vaccinium darrowii TaxID=229202 RepID=A0ACB7Y243_9ERIC|nr:hypothetical protein Vadar_027476 [Vaccinium darrowii]